MDETLRAAVEPDPGTVRPAVDGRYELHCHLDCAVRPATLVDLAAEAGLRLDRPVREFAVAPPDVGSLAGFLRHVQLAVDVLQSPYALRRAARELVEDWRDDGVRYGEVRFAPQLHTRAGMTLDDAVTAVASGLAEGRAATGVATALLLCCLRHQGEAESLGVADAAVRHRGTVAGIDLAGDERFPGRPHAAAMALARAGGLPVTVHAGEAAGPKSLWEAVDELGAVRIGHGVRCVTDRALVARLATDRITLETCPRCNVLTGAVPSLAEHPVDALLHAGVPVTVSTDARTTADTTLTREFAALADTFGWGPDEVARVQAYACDAAFGPAP